MDGAEVNEVDPAELRLPGSRDEGADPAKLQRQISRHGDRLAGMPPILVLQLADGSYLISDGVTRATRAAKLRPGQTVPVKVTGTLPLDSSRFHTVAERLP